MRRPDHYRLLLLVACLAVASLAIGPAPAGPPEIYRVLIVPVDYPDLPGTLNFADLQTQWVDSLDGFFDDVSYGALQVEPTVIQTVSRLPFERWQYNHRGGISPLPTGFCEIDPLGIFVSSCENDADCLDTIFGFPASFGNCRFQMGFCEDRATACDTGSDCLGIGGGTCDLKSGLCSNDLSTTCTSRSDCGDASCNFFFHPWEFDEPLQSLLGGDIVLGSNGLAPSVAPDDPFDVILFIDAVPTSCASCGNTWGTAALCQLYGIMYPPRSLAVDPDASHTYRIGYSNTAAGGNACLIEPMEFGTAAHELGHAIALGRGHPAGYGSNWELMDSGNACSPGVYTRISKALLGEDYPVWFPGWIPDAKITVFSPVTGGGTEVLAPVEFDPSLTASPMGLKVELTAGDYYIVECRANTFPERFCFDDGVLISKAAPPGTYSADGLDYVLQLQLRPGWPDTPPAEGRWRSHFLEGDNWEDLENDVQIDVGPTLPGGACTVTVSYGPGAQATVADMAMLPWLSEPMNSYETVDIWVDSSCNGYSDDDPGDPTRLKYGRRPDDSVIGSGDDPCLDHENRIYARVRNLGQSIARDVVVHFEVTEPLGVGIRGSDGWTLIDKATLLDFSCLGMISPGNFCDVYVPWTPTSGDIATGIEVPTGNVRFGLHSCLRNRSDAVPGEVLLANQDGVREQENISVFEVRRDPALPTYELAQGAIFLFHENNSLREGARYFVDVRSQLPFGWTLEIGDDTDEYWMSAGQTRILPLRIQAPSGAPIGEMHLVEVDVYSIEADDSPDPNNDEGYARLVSGVVVQVQTVLETDMTVTAAAVPPDDCSADLIQVDGCLSQPIPGVQIAIDYDGPSGVITQLSPTNAGGCFEDFLVAPEPGSWTVQSFWQGDLLNSSTVGPEIAVSVFDPNDVDCDLAPNGSDNCVDVPNAGQVDSDNDGFGDECDCNPVDVGAFAIPGEVVGVSFLDSTTLSWSSAVPAAGSSTLHQVLSGPLTDLPVDGNGATVCEDAFVAGTSLSVPGVPLVGEGTWFQVRGRNSCGTGPLSLTSDGTSRFDPACLDCSHDTCTTGPVLDPDCSPCVRQICDADSFCCDTQWDALCVVEVRAICGSLECPESQGACVHGPCESGVALVAGCDAPPAATSCVADICAADPWCCQQEWDLPCTYQVGSVCGMTCQ